MLINRTYYRINKTSLIYIYSTIYKQLKFAWLEIIFCLSATNIIKLNLNYAFRNKNNYKQGR